MNIEKRNNLVNKLRSQRAPQLVPVDEFFDGNDDIASIACNLLEHPGIDTFRATFALLGARSDVDAIFVRIAEVDPGEGCWPFSDTVFVIGALTEKELASQLSSVAPEEIGTARDFGAPRDLLARFDKPILAAWWD
jgi:hypothetical protein